jgi:hypothetical protein
MLQFTKKEKILLKKLNTPAKVQDFLNSMQFNFEKSGETLKPPILTLRTRKAHCFEGALLGAYILSIHGFVPYILHLKAKKGDFDHVITPFKVGDCFGALSKTNHAVLRYREPIYKNIRELVMSYFHEYFLNNGVKTLRSYSEIFNLNLLSRGWELSEDDLWYIDKKLDKLKHHDIITKNQINKLRKADKIEIASGKIVEYR